MSTATVLTNTGKNIITNRLIGNSQTYPVYMAIGTGATGAGRTAAATDTELSNQVETRVNSNAGSVAKTTTTGDTYQVTQAFTLTADRSIDEAALFDAATGGNTFVSSTFTAISLSSGDTVQFTMKVVLS